MLLKQEQRPLLSQRIDPKLIMSNTILQLSSLELMQSVEAEIMENPALETLEETGCEGNCIDPAVCPYCSARASMRAHEEKDSLDSGDVETEYDGLWGLEGDNEEEFDVLGNLEAETTLQEHLTVLLRATVSEEDYYIGEYIINSLDSRGWLLEKTDSIAHDLNIAESDVCRLLAVIQSFDPPGVGAQNLQECLLLQLKFLQTEDDPAQRSVIAVAIRLLLEQFENVCISRYNKIARTLKIPLSEVKQAVEYIRKRLNPFPAGQFHPPWSNRSTHTKASVRPDVIIRRTAYGYEIEVLQLETLALSINSQYREAYVNIKKGSTSHSPEERKHYIEYVERAEQFIHNINQRRYTLRQITRCIVECQTGFLETGSRQFLRPLTRTNIARILNIHESTVSRATANKFVQLPNQEVYGFDIFFKGSLSAKDAIGAIIQEEDPANPLSDQQIVDLLQERGITLARRTIVKYRSQAKILSSTRRRR